MSWTDERVELLKKMWNEGHSASTIAKELGGVTRNAVIGKVHRLGLSNRNGPETSAETPEPSRPAAPEPNPAVVDLAQVKAERAAQPKPKPAAAPAPKPEPAAVAEPEEPEEEQVETYTPKPIIPAGQPLPPQPSANEIDPEALATVREVEKTAMKLSLLELTERTCKWPIGDPATPDFWFCGLPVKPGKPYCEAHVAVAFQPMSTRRDRKR
ncbi:MAG: GcrA cell cycle regulator [Rhodobacteraceae bacterium]|nr:GcrA cell cycle regulator [Paracoccaceae bacterium]